MGFFSGFNIFNLNVADLFKMKTEIQTNFFTALVEAKVQIAVYLRHGIKLKGKLVGFDEAALFLDDSHHIQMILIDAVSTVTAAQSF
jgi:RNA chaperone Hfq